jgi:tetratricopeptide (TPR) repeat protein
MAMSIWFIRSRAGIISLVAILVYLSPKKLIWIVAMLAVFSGTWFVTKKDLFFRILEIDSFGLRSTMSRFCIWSTTIDVIRARPLMGWGLGNFETAYRRFQHPSAELLRYGKSTMFAHNGFLQGTAETGLPGIFFLLWGLVGVIRNALPFLFKERGLFSVVIVFFLTSLTNYSLLLPFNGLVFTTAMALLAIRAASSNKTWPLVELTRLRILPTFAISLLTIFLASTGISEVLEIRGRLDEAVRACPIRSEVWYELALQNLLRSKNALPFLDRALILNQQNSFYWQRKALVLVNYQQSEESKIDQCFKQAQMLAPFHAPFYIQEGFYRLRKSQTESARILFEKAANLEPLAPLPHYGLALTLAQKGDRLAMGVQLDLVRSLKSQQRKLEGDPVYGGPYREMFSSEYARFLFGIDESRLNPPSPASSS